MENGKNGKKAVIDTNSIIRYLVDDEPQKTESLENLLDKAQKGEIRVLIPSIVIAELVWILESNYQLGADQIAEIVDAILNTPGVDVTEKHIISSALRLYRTKNIDLVDAWIIGFAVEQ